MERHRMKSESVCSAGVHGTDSSVGLVYCRRLREMAAQTFRGIDPDVRHREEARREKLYCCNH
jgi:hypothetical protein